jgi:ATP-dependent DNA ligase
MVDNQTENFIKHIIKDGGEGIILQHTGSLYLPGKSHALFKLKVWFIFFLIFNLCVFISFVTVISGRQRSNCGKNTG